jgi:polyhydroxyalkanoate synthesis repressor PhaR
MAERIRIVKKYQNRKLYDTEDSCYVTLDGIARMIREGEDIVVIDNNSKQDVTALILTQVLYEQEKTNQSVLPVSILTHIVKSGSNNLFEFMQKYILGAMEAHLKVQDDLRLHVEKLSQKGDLNADEAQNLLQQIESQARLYQSQLDEKIETRVKSAMAGSALSHSSPAAAQTTPPLS